MEPINESDLDWMEYDRDETDGHTEFRRKQLSEAAEGEDIGCSLYELPAGSRSWPYHYHTANEEAIYVLAGSGQLRVDDGTQPLLAGDYVAFPAREEGAHRIVNDGDEPIRYLMLSTMNEPDVTVYPDMEKFGVYVGSPPGGRDERPFEGYYRIDDDTEYWDDR